MYKNISYTYSIECIDISMYVYRCVCVCVIVCVLVCRLLVYPGLPLLISMLIARG